MDVQGLMNRSQGQFSVGGIASGLDTEDIVQELLALERAPINRYEQRQERLGEKKRAWGEINAKLSTLRGATDELTRTARFDDMMSVTSSNESAVSITATGPVDHGSLDFTVDQLAQRQQRASGDTFTGLNDAIGDRELTIRIDGIGHDVTSDLGDDATLGDVVDAINASNVGVNATALQVSAGEFQLVLDAAETGEAGEFEIVDAAGWDAPFEVTQQAQDAELRVGGVTVTRSSNTIDDLVDGARIQLHQTTTQPVNVTAERDVDGAVEAVGGFVEALNGALAKLAELTSYDPETGQAGTLQGDTSASRLASQLRDGLSRPVPELDGALGFASDLGISITRDGLVELDEARLRDAFTSDFDGTAARLARSATSTDPAATYASSLDRTLPGTYEVEVTQAAQMAAVLGDTYQAPGAEEPVRFEIQRGNGDPIEILLTDRDATAADAADRINAAFAAAGWSDYRAEVEDGALRLSSGSYGSRSSFTVTEVEGGALGLAGTHVGVDVAGTIDGQAATGNGRILRAAEGPADGLSLRIDGLPDDTFEVTYSGGIVGQASDALRRAEGSTGLVQQARDALDRQVEQYDLRIESFQRRLESREVTLRRQFVAMEQAMGRFNDQSAQLQQALAGLPGAQQR